MKVIGNKVLNMAKVKKYLKMVLLTKVISIKELDMAKVDFGIMMADSIRELLVMGNSMEMEKLVTLNICMKESGNLGKWMGLERANGLMRIRNYRHNISANISKE
jgi:hypothetical protein